MQHYELLKEEDFCSTILLAKCRKQKRTYKKNQRSETELITNSELLNQVDLCPEGSG